MKKIFIFILVISSIGFADIKKDIAICAGKDNDVAKLVCYDSLAEKLGVDTPTIKSTKGKGKWGVREETSPIDDSKRVYLTLDAENTIQGRFKSERPSLYIRCSENKTEAYVDWGVYLGTDSTRILTRLDKKKAKNQRWGISTDYEASFVPGKISYIKKMMKHDKLLLQVTPYGASPVMATFNIRGLDEAIKPLREACHW